MKREGYKRLGEYIAPYLEKNVGRKVTLSQGINNNKYFQTPRQVAVDSENDQIVRTGQFAYNKATTRNGDKISIAYREGPNCTVSSAYQVFYIKDEEKLNPHYLLMWFKRPEFDRYARFKSFGSAHEFFTWDEMCNVYLPIPDIAEQRRIVAEYQAIEQRIENNNRLIKTLEATAQAIYHHTFVENIDPENLPEGWRIDYLYNLGKFTNGLACQNYEGKGEYDMPVLKIRELNQGHPDKDSDKVDDSFPNTHIVKYGDLVFSWSATLLVKYWASDNVALNQHLFKVTSEKYPLWLLYFGIKKHVAVWENLISAKATSMGHIKIEDLQRADVYIPNQEIIYNTNKVIKPIIDLMVLTEKENLKLLELKNLLLSKLS